MKKVWAIIATILSIPLLLLAAVFLVAAMVKPERLLVAGVLFIFGGALLFPAIAIFRRQAEISPEALATGALTLARKAGGELTSEQMAAEFRIPASRAQETLERLAAAGQAQAEVRNGRSIYVFPGLQPARVTRRCPYCGSEYPVRDALTTCPHCGATLTISKS